MTTIPVDTLLQVQDTTGTWHAAAVGPGVLCQRTTPDEAAPAVQTVAWDYGTTQVGCRDCLPKLRALQLAAR